MSEDFESLLGYSPRADVCLESIASDRKIWIEFEISRADPVANHAKFATAHLFKPFQSSDSFVSMVSSHVSRGRRNLASNTIHLLRHVGISAFQTVLLPTLEPEHIQSLNHAPLASLENSNLDVLSEISRVFHIVDPVIEKDGDRIHFVSELFDVIRNLHRWNAEIATKHGTELWKRRTVTYFVFDPVSELFAPSKFCAYVIPVRASRFEIESSNGQMTMPMYCALDESDRQFDGHRARLHLTNHLGMQLVAPDEAPAVAKHFDAWYQKHAEAINVHPAGPKFLVPPTWYR